MDLKLKLKLRPSFFFFSFLIFIFLLQKPDFGSASTPKCISTEGQALLTFKQSLTDPSGRFSSWSGPDCCKWRGVFCDRKTSHVIKIDLRNPNQTLKTFEQYGEYKEGSLGGKIHPSLTRLKFLSYLDLSSNDFNFTEIPQFIGRMVSLRYLNLSCSSFSGEVPASLGNLSKLESLDLYAQSFIDNDEAPVSFTLRASSLGWLSGLSSSLAYLKMGFVSLSGAGETWLEDFSRLSKLRELHLSNCELKNLPLYLPSSANLKLLEVLDLSQNSLSSPIPNWIFDLTSLRKLFLQFAYLQGSIPSGFKNLKLLETLDLSHSQLRGEIPAALGDLPQLKYLDLSVTYLQGQIHSFLDAFSRNKGNSLVYLNLQSNSFNGTLPESLGALRSLQILELSSNSFTGSLPASVGNMSSLKKLDLSYNSMNGTIPESLGKLEELVDLNLMANKWEGVLLKSHFINLRSLKTFTLTGEPNRSVVFKVPSTWVPPFRLEQIIIENCQIGPSFPMWLQVQNKLNSVTLRNNGIADKIPHSWFSGIASHVTDLILTNNRIKGTLPQNLVFPNLYTVDLSSNNFEGPFPRWTTNATNIYLYQNNLSGPLPLNIGALMPRMGWLYLFDNSFTGEIPSSLCEVTELYNLNLRNNRFSGSFPKCWHDSSQLFTIDASENNISGEIPESLCDLRDLTFLHLNQNAFEGNIPNMFPNCYDIQHIDLSGNNISGVIPTEILDLSYLRILNLSRNSIEGSIPGKVSNVGRLETLDLSRNKLSGAIPQSLAAISSLHTLNLSFNKLAGRIPKNLKFKDPSIYVGNELLCGKPLPKKCPRKQS
ncbi:hypothetical protein N665_0212s0013 [Sinapis alba]|nr:hypothetical protein N665_0212s0013 [Sinapis alba]